MILLLLLLVQLQAKPLAGLKWCVEEREAWVGVGQIVAEEGTLLACTVLEMGEDVAADRRHADEDEEEDEEDPNPGNFLIRRLV